MRTGTPHPQSARAGSGRGGGHTIGGPFNYFRGRGGGALKKSLSAYRFTSISTQGTLSRMTKTHTYISFSFVLNLRR